MLSWIFGLSVFVRLCRIITTQEDNIVDGRSCINNAGRPTFCYPPFDNHASTGRKVIATNTCGISGRQKYCIGLSSAEMRSRCAYCDDSNVLERHSADFLTDHNSSNWWQSETLRDNKNMFNQQSINLTLNLGNQFLVAFVHLQFKSPRPSAMVIYKKQNNNSPWEPWQYFGSNCLKYFHMNHSRDGIIQRYNEVLCTEDFSSLNEFYDGVVMFATVPGRPGSEDFFSNKKLMEWSTASQIRIELRKMHTFGEQNDEEELLLTYFYAIKSLQVAGRCWCNGHGNECRKSSGEGLEPQLYCVCHPSHHTTGQSCERCDSFYQDRPWQAATATNANICQRCDCNENSDSCIFNEDLYIKSGNVSGGMCLNCRWNTKGPHCNECMEGHYKDPEHSNRCIPCNCDSVGAANAQCDNQGKCICKPGIVGDKCNRCKEDHYNFGLSGCRPCNCHLPGTNMSSSMQCNPSNGVCICKKNVMGEKCDRCVPGYFSLSNNDPLGCRPCFCFAHTRECSTATGFILEQIESEFNENVDEWKYGVPNQATDFIPMLDKTTILPSITWFNYRDVWRDDYFFLAPKKFLGNRRLSYNLNILLTLSFDARPDYKPFPTKLVSMINDVQLISDTTSVSVPFDIGGNKLPEIGSRPTVYVFRLNEESGFWRDQVDHFTFQSILSNLVGLRIRLTNPFGYVRLHKVAMQTALDGRSVKSSNGNVQVANSVEQCSCPPQYSGLSCENCASGYHRESAVGTEFVKCIKCMCNNQSDTCDTKTGMCHCSFNTEGHNCDKCRTGYYGDPTSQIRGICKHCGCPGGTGCEFLKLADGDRVICTECPDNLGGYRCDRCRDNYFGNPKLNISCRPCQCHGNIDYFNSCDPITGKCPNCIYNSAGDYCESCKSGFHLVANEKAPNRCQRCICNPYGSKKGGNDCDVNTGQCLCEPLVGGLKCDTCRPGFYNLTETKPCQSCQCSELGSINETCHQQSGQCHCKPGVTGKHCDQCEFGYFGLSKSGCKKCLCDVQGSKSLQCSDKTGQCICKSNVIGMNCDKCLENHHNLTSDGCQTCPPCYGLLQSRILKLKNDLLNLSPSSPTMNVSNHQIWNVTFVIRTTQKMNDTVFEIFQKYMQNYERLKELQREIAKANKSLDDLEREIIETRDPNINEEIISLVRDIQMTDKSIADLLAEFPRNLDLLKTHITNKNEKNDKMTKIAEQANNYQMQAIQRKEELDKIWVEADQGFTDSLKNFVDLMGNYHKYIIDSSQFNISALRTLSDRIQTDSLNNLLTIRDANEQLKNLENQVNVGKMKMEAIVNGSNNLLADFQAAEANLIRLENLFKNWAYNNIDLKMLENKFKGKNNYLNDNIQVYTEAQQIMARLDDAQNNLQKALANANQTLDKLQDLLKDFNEVVNKSKLEAERQMLRLPQLKSKIVGIQRDIDLLKGSSVDLITKIMSVNNDLQLIYNQSADLHDKLQDFMNEIINLLNRSSEDLKLAENIENLAQKKHADGLSAEKDFLDLEKQIKTEESNDRDQNDAVELSEKSLRKILNELSLIGNKSDSENDVKLLQFEKIINALEGDIENYFKTELNGALDNVKDLDKEYLQLMNDRKLTEQELNRLEVIERHMVDVTRSICYKSGGKTEGL